MKNAFLFPALLLALLFSTSHALANQHGSDGNTGGFTGPAAQGGFTGPGPAIVTIKRAHELVDDTWITLKGNIIRHEGKDIYVFKDSSGEARIDIDDDAWGGQYIAPTDTVELVGKVDKDWGKVEVEIKTVRKVQ